ncbi:recombinase family protein [Paucibacter sp. DJ4R-1]|nr:recombinase family protein [Paucibacter sp. DJ4R-1]
MSIAAAYARYSSEEQRSTSIDDQLRRCHETAARESLTLKPSLIFSDAAVTGKSDGTSKRTDYLRLIDAIESRQCDVLVVDELSRLTRHASESVKIMDYVDQIGLRIVTNDGIDTAREGWKSMWLVKTLVAVQEVDNTSARVSRGLVGQLERGYQIAAAPLGFRGVKELDSRGRALGTVWRIYEPEAELVREVYKMRFNGMSAGAIAQVMQLRGIPPPGHQRKGGSALWRPATVFRLITNSIYRGVFTYHGSNTTKYKSRRQRKTVESVEYARPNCRIVSDEVWHYCNPPVTPMESRAPNGGGIHLLSGLMKCGTCQSIISIGGDRRSRTMVCPSCELRVRMKIPLPWYGRTTVTAATSALLWALEQLFSESVRKTFQEKLRLRVTQGPDTEQQEVKTRLARLEASVHRLKQLAMNPELGEDLFLPELQQSTTEIRIAKARLLSLEQHSKGLTQTVLAAQLAVDPLPLLRSLLNSPENPCKIRSVLRRLLKDFDFIDKPCRGVSVFRLTFQPGVFLAETSGTALIDESTVTFKVVTTRGPNRSIPWLASGHQIE